MKDTLLEEKKRKFWTKVFVGFLAVLSMVCIGVMNSKYDSLARYPYKDRESREIIREKLNKSEIEYIIEYSIPPNMFISFINEKGFNIYHAAEYKRLSEYCWQESPAAIVRMVEETYEDLTVDGLISLLDDYSYDELHYFLKNGDSYAPGTVLVNYGGSPDVWLDKTHSVSVRTPNNLMVVDESIPSEDGHEIVVAETIQQPLADLCAAIQGDLKNENGCGGLYITEGYVSYQMQEARYLASGKDGSVEAPGHNEHQLGLAVDFAVGGLNDALYLKSEQCRWLKEHSWEYGFVMSHTADAEELTGMPENAAHYRYIGAQLAAQLNAENKSFAEYSREKEENMEKSSEE